MDSEGRLVKKMGKALSMALGFGWEVDGESMSMSTMITVMRHSK